jgi:hypothetical protein
MRVKRLDPRSVATTFRPWFVGTPPEKGIRYVRRPFHGVRYLLKITPPKT